MAITQAQWVAGWGSDATALGEPLWETGDWVYLKEEYTQTAGQNLPFKYNPYYVIGILITSVAGVIQGQSAAADGTPDTATSGAHYYLRNDSTSQTRSAHEFEVDSLANIKTLIGVEAADWADPS